MITISLTTGTRQYVASMREQYTVASWDLLLEDGAGGPPAVQAEHPHLRREIVQGRPVMFQVARQCD
jgi:hypothetical protein